MGRGVRRSSLGARAARWLIPLVMGASAPEPALVRLEIEPGEVRLEGRRASAQLIVTGHAADGTVRDFTHRANWSSADPAMVAVTADGYVTPIGDGRGTVVARVGNVEARGVVEVTNSAGGPAVDFDHEVLPALTKAGCNQGACHGTPTGKNGFRLSLRGYDPGLDFTTLTREAGDRRTNRLNPEASLILLKGSGALAHEGGQRFNSSSVPFRLLRDWIAEGLHSAPADSPKVVRLEVAPAVRVLEAPDREQQLIARAVFSDGQVRDVTRLARYSTTDDDRASVDAFGRVRLRKRGEVTILVGFESQLATARLVLLEPVADFAWTEPPAEHFIDCHVDAKLKLLRILPSELADDATFLRRVHLDLTGLPPAPEDIKRFLDDRRADKRARRIDALLESPEYVDFWTLKWSDRLGCNQRFVGKKGAYSFHRWIRDQVAANVPFDRFVRAIVTAKGSNYTNPPASFYRRLRSAEDAAESVSQLFLGVRLQCARCHNHVAERWTQDDYYGFAAFFSHVRFKNGPQYYEIYNKEETVYLNPSSEVVQPRTGQTMAPKALLAPPAQLAPGNDRREVLADWLVSPSNPFFAKAAVNRIWYHLFGRGIVEPVDDLRDSNPAASDELLTALADDFIAHGFDTKQTIRTILHSRAYQRSSTPNTTNADDARYFSHAMVRLLSAEQLLDAASQATGVSERLFHLPRGTRAAQVPDGEFVHPFLRAFGQPPRSVACECERGSDSTLEQALELVGGRTFHAKVSAPDNRIARLLASGASDTAIVDELFLATLGRLPGRAERELALNRFSVQASARRRGAEDLLWSLFNHPEFLFQH